MDNNTALAAIYAPHVRQFVVVNGLVWVHEPYGDWFIRAHLSDDA